MKQKILLLCVALFTSVARSFSGVTVTVPEVNITPGGTAYVLINADFGTQPYTAYQFDIAYPEGITAETDNDGNPTFAKGPMYVDEKHLVSSGFSPAGLSRFQCFSTTSDALTAQSGTLLVLTVKAKAGMAMGTYQATIDPIEFVQTDATPDRPDALTFNIVVSRQVVLDEESPLAPTAASNVNVTVKRTINANSWSTICLPFAMSEAQCKVAFGNDVQIGDFVSTDPEYDDDDNVIAIKVKFSKATAIEANHPYIIRVSESVNEFTVDGVNVSPNESEALVERDNGKSGSRKVYYGGFYGTYHHPTTLEALSLFLNGNKFWYSKGLTQMKGYRAYFKLTDKLSDVENASSRITMLHDGTTVISTITATVDDGESYTLSGRRIETPTKGLYIKRGKKVIVK